MDATALLSPDASMSIREPIELRDGTEVRLHAMRGDDADALLRFHHQLSPETTYLRFFSVHPELSTRELERFTHVDHQRPGGDRRHRRRGDRRCGPLRPIARRSRCRGGLRDRRRLAGRRTRHGPVRPLAARARELGVERFTAEVLPHNRRMLNLFHHSGLSVTACLRDGVVHVVLDLGDDPLTGS